MVAFSIVWLDVSPQEKRLSPGGTMFDKPVTTAALAGVTILATSTIGQAATTSQVIEFQVGNSDLPLNFKTFDTSLGTLTGVSLDLESRISAEDYGAEYGIEIDGKLVSSIDVDPFLTVDYNFLDLDPTTSGIALSFFEGDGVSTWTATAKAFSAISALWVAEGYYDGLAVTFTYDKTVAPDPVPLPASLPLVAGGMILLAGFAKRRKS